MTARLHKSYEISLALFFLCIGLYLVPFSIMGNNLAFIPGGLGDARFNNYILEHGFQWLTGHQKSFWDAPFFYPTPNVVAFSDSHLGTLPIYSMFRLAGLDRETSFQGWSFAIFSLDYLACVWALKKFSIRLPGAIAGAFVFSFSLPVIAQVNHPQLLPRFMIPLAFYFTWSYLNKPALRSLAGLCLSVVWQMYCTIYMGYFLIYALMAFAVSYFIMHHEGLAWREILWGSKSQRISRTAIIAISGLLLLPLMLPYYRYSLEYGLRSWSEILPLLPRPQSYIVADSGSVVWGWLSRYGSNLTNLTRSRAHCLFIGALPWISVFAVIFSVRQKNKNTVTEVGIMSTLSIFFLIILTLYWNGFTLYKIVTIIPGAGSIRAVTRIMMVLSFFFAVAVGVFFTKLENMRFTKNKPGRPLYFSLFLLVVLLIDQSSDERTRYSKIQSQVRANTIAEQVLKKNPAARIFAYMPPKSDATDSDTTYEVHIDAMMASQLIHIPTINGYSGGLPRNYDFYAYYDQAWALNKWIATSKVKYDGQHMRSPDNLFDGLVIIGTPKVDLNRRDLQ